MWGQRKSALKTSQQSSVRGMRDFETEFLAYARKGRKLFPYDGEEWNKTKGGNEQIISGGAFLKEASNLSSRGSCLKAWFTSCTLRSVI